MIIRVKHRITQEFINRIGLSDMEAIEMLAHNLYVDIRNKIRNDKIEPEWYEISIKANVRE
jgi:hypothetical protein